MQRKYILPIFLFFQILFLKIIAFFPESVEHFYSNGLYVFIADTLRITLGKIPISVGDILYGFLIIYTILSVWKTRKTWKIKWKDNILKTLSFVSVAFFFFHLLWAMNYYRMPLFEKMNIKREYSDEELIHFTEKLIVKTNEIHTEITHNPNIKVINPYSQEKIFMMTQNGFDHLSEQYSFFTYQKTSIKKSLFSLPLTYMGFGGYLNPFTNEAQVNDKLPMYGFPMVVCHEMAHQIGYASESECNFVGFLACVKNEDLYFQYSAYSLALRYCLRNIEMKDEKKLNQILEKINPGVLENFMESEKFWKKYDTFIDKGFHVLYDQFLKFNQQKDGMVSYSKFVDLLINHYIDKDF
jgi:hypothetical protein